MNPVQGKLLGIAVRARSRGPMTEHESAEITEARGVLDDSRGRPGERQVTVLAVEDWDAACKELDKAIPWTARRANLLVEGVALKESTGAIIQVGEVRLEVTGETDPCSRMDQTEPGLLEALLPDWRGGVCCRVLSGGEIAKGDSVAMEPRAD